VEDTARRPAFGYGAPGPIAGEEQPAGDGITGVLDERAALGVVAEPVPEIVVFVGIGEVMADLVCDGEVPPTRPRGWGVEHHAFFSERQPVAPATGAPSFPEGRRLTEGEAEAVDSCLLRVAA
jgi:hypothetical protein